MPMIRDVTRHVGTGNRGIFLKNWRLRKMPKKPNYF